MATVAPTVIPTAEPSFSPSTTSPTSSSATSDLSDVYAYVAVFFVFYLFLRKLLKFAEKKILRADPLPKSDEFLTKNGYSYDYAFVFQVYGEDFDKFDTFQKRFTMRNCIERLKHALLDVKFFYSVQRDEIYVKVRADLERLRQEASRINYKLRLDPFRLRSKAIIGKKRNGRTVWKPIVIRDDHKVSPYDPYDYIYAAYDATAYVDGMYKLYDNLEEHKSIFRGVDRINLLLSIMEGKLSYGGGVPPGANLNISKLVDKKVVLAAFPLHDFDELTSLQRRWLILAQFPWHQPVDHVKDYFGEKIGFYFLYLGHYVELLMAPALLGTITYIVQKESGLAEHFLMPYFAAFMVIWSTFYVEIWKRKQSRMAMKWGSSGIEDEEQDRPLFSGTIVASPVNGLEMTYFPSYKKFRRASIANV